MKREKFGSRLGFILVSAGCAIGIGNVWKYPYMCGEYGGAAFILIYLAFLLIMGIPAMVCEFSIGRGSKRSVALTFVGRKMLAVIVVLVLILVIVQVYRRKSWLMDGCIAFVGIGVPILWIVAFHHFYKVHYWFGYRVLFGTVLAILLLIGRKEEMKE